MRVKLLADLDPVVAVALISAGLAEVADQPPEPAESQAPTVRELQSYQKPGESLTEAKRRLLAERQGEAQCE